MINIDYNSIRSFPKGSISFDTVYDDLYDKYKITNISYKHLEALEALAIELMWDYNDGIVNYESYLYKGMDARIMMEVRRNLYLKFMEETMKSFCKDHSRCFTAREVADLRLSYIRRFRPGYDDLDWQYTFLVGRLWNQVNVMDFYFDFDNCFLDSERPWATPKSPEDRKADFIAYHENNLFKSMGWDNEGYEKVN